MSPNSTQTEFLFCRNSRMESSFILIVAINGQSDQCNFYQITLTVAVDELWEIRLIRVMSISPASANAGVFVLRIVGWPL